MFKEKRLEFKLKKKKKHNLVMEVFTIHYCLLLGFVGSIKKSLL